MRPLEILIVDDDIDYADIMAEYLLIKGHNPTIVNSGKAALEKIKSVDIDVTFMDVLMPEMNGVETFKAMRKIKPRAKVIMMTGYAVDTLLDEAMDAGANAVMHKPINLKELLTILEELNHQDVVLLVDDDPEFTKSVQVLLQDQGYTVEISSSGDSVVERLFNNNIKILLLDLRLPGLSGIEVIKELDKKGIHVHTILITAYIEEEKENLKTLKAYDLKGVLSKPFEPAALLRLLAELDMSVKH